jgi:Putative addiction module component
MSVEEPTEPLFLDVEDVLEIHALQLEAFGGRPAIDAPTEHDVHGIAASAWRRVCDPGTVLRMSSRARRIIEEALALPKDELVRLVAELQEQVESSDSPAEIQAAWRDELVKRVRSIGDGSAVLHDGDEVDAELAKILEER